MIIEKKKNYI